LKKNLSYILIGVIAIAAIVLFIIARYGKEKEFDDRLTLNRKDKIPYGAYVAYQNLKNIFPKAQITTSRSDPGYWDEEHDKQAYIIIASQFSPDDYEMKRIVSFLEKGNDVFVSAAKVSYYVEKYLKCDILYPIGYDYLSIDDLADSMRLSIQTPFANETYLYPGKNLGYVFHKIDTATTSVLGYNDRGQPDFIHLKAGKGNLYLHLAPLAFSNYFLLHKKNIGYYRQAFSFLSPRTNKIIWDEYFIKKREKEEEPEQKGWLSVFFRYPSLKWAFLTALFTLLVYVLIEMRRKQRQIPVIKAPQNDSLDFVKTIGRLYHDKADHTNLAKKMTAYFLEYVRNRYKLTTNILDDAFIQSLHYKSGVEEEEIRKIVYFINEMNASRPAINEGQLIYFHKQLESFYKKA